MIRSFLLTLLLAPFVFAGGADSSTAAAIAGGQGRQPCALFLAELDVMSMSIGGVAFAATLIGYHFAFRRYIRDQVGLKETKITEIAGQPLEVRAAVKFITHPELEQHLEGYVTRDDLHDVQQTLDAKIEDNFRSLDEKRSRSIGNLHEHLTGTTKSLTEKITESDEKIHDRLDAMSSALRSEMDGKLSEVRSDIGAMPGRIITLLQQTGQIGQGGKR